MLHRTVRERNPHGIWDNVLLQRVMQITLPCSPNASPERGVNREGEVWRSRGGDSGGSGRRGTGMHLRGFGSPWPAVGKDGREEMVETKQGSRRTSNLCSLACSINS